MSNQRSNIPSQTAKKAVAVPKTVQAVVAERTAEEAETDNSTLGLLEQPPNHPLPTMHGLEKLQGCPPCHGHSD